MKNSDIFSKAFTITFKHKALWLAALLASINLANLINLMDPSDVMDTPFAASLVLPMITLFLAFIALGITLVVAPRGASALILGVDGVRSGQPISFRESWDAAKSSWGRVLVWNILYGLGAVILLVVSMIPLIIGFMKSSDVFYLWYQMRQSGMTVPGMWGRSGGIPWLLAGTPLCCVTMLLVTLTGYVATFVIIAMVLDDLKLRPAIRYAWQMVRTHIKRILIVMLAMWGIGIVIAVAAGGMAFFLLSPNLILAAAAIPVAAKVAVKVVLGFVAWVVATGMGIFTTTFSYAVWVLLYRDMQTSEPVEEAIAENI